MFFDWSFYWKFKSFMIQQTNCLNLDFNINYYNKLEIKKCIKFPILNNLNPIQVLLAKPSGTDSDQLVPKRFPITWSVNLILFQRKKSEWVLTPKCIKPSTDPPEKQLQSKSSTKPKCQQKRSKKRDLRSTSIKDFSTPTSPEFMSSSRTTKKCTFSWNCARMGNFLTSSITMDRFLKGSLLRFSKRFCQP